jgi:hypothetical protein
MEEREELEEETGLARVSLVLPFYTRSRIPVESRQRRAAR